MNNFNDWMNEFVITIKSGIGWGLLVIGFMIVFFVGKSFISSHYFEFIKNIDDTTPEFSITKVKMIFETLSVFLYLGLSFSLIGSILLIGLPKKGLK